MSGKSKNEKRNNLNTYFKGLIHENYMWFYREANFDCDS